MQMSLNQLNKTNFYMKSTRTRFEKRQKATWTWAIRSWCTDLTSKKEKDHQWTENQNKVLFARQTLSVESSLNKQ